MNAKNLCAGFFLSSDWCQKYAMKYTIKSITIVSVMFVGVIIVLIKIIMVRKQITIRFVRIYLRVE